LSARTVLHDADITRALTRISHEILESNRGPEGLVILGIPTRGVNLAQRIGALVTEFGGRSIPVGALDVTMYLPQFLNVADGKLTRTTRRRPMPRCSPPARCWTSPDAVPSRRECAGWWERRWRPRRPSHRRRRARAVRGRGGECSHGPHERPG